MPYMPEHSNTALTAAELEHSKPEHWDGTSQAIWREFAFESYLAGVNFAVGVAQLAEQQNHHPDLAIGYKRVKVTYSTHDSGGVTPKDLAAALAVNQLAAQAP